MTTHQITAADTWATTAPARVCFADATAVHCGTVLESLTSDHSGDPTWLTRVHAALRPGHRIVAAFSFEDDQPAIAHVVTAVADAPHDLAGLVEACRPPVPTARTHWQRWSADDAAYARTVEVALEAIDAGGVQKVVLGRSVETLSDPPLTSDELVHALGGAGVCAPAGRYLYSVPVAVDQTLVGASPELLVRRRGSEVEAMPLAGSLPRAEVPERDEAERRLLASTKDRAEHAHVVDDLVARLRTVCGHVRAAEPEVVGTDSMWHLATRISAELRAEHTQTPSGSALALARLVHPTPAVGGVPWPTARGLIAGLEQTPRRWFGGAVGWMDETGDGEFALTLRSGVLTGRRLLAWAGAGIVAGSDPASEARETAAKLRTMVQAVEQ